MILNRLNFSYSLEEARFTEMTYNFVIKSDDQDLEKTKKDLLSSFEQLEEILDTILLDDESEKKKTGTISPRSTRIGYSYKTPSTGFGSTANLKYDIETEQDKVISLEIDIYHMESPSDAHILKVYDRISRLESAEKTLAVTQNMRKIEELRKGLQPEDLCIDYALTLG